jgi:hypothetical protein
MTIVTLGSGCGNAYPGDGTRCGGGQVAISGLLDNHEKSSRWAKASDSTSRGSAFVIATGVCGRSVSPPSGTHTPPGSRPWGSRHPYGGSGDSMGPACGVS